MKWLKMIVYIIVIVFLMVFILSVINTGVRVEITPAPDINGKN